MHGRVFDKAWAVGSTRARKTAPAYLHAQLRKAFREWREASKACSAFQSEIEKGASTPAAARRLAELEECVEAKARAFEEAKQRCFASPFYMATLYATIAGYK